MSAEPQRPRVLLADDEVLIRDLVEETLQEAGYEVTCAATGVEALAALDAAPPGGAGFVGLVTDINFGGPPVGWEVASRARELNASIAVVYMTGDSAHEWSAHGVPQSTVVSKPFAPSQIAVALANLVNVTDSGSGA